MSIKDILSGLNTTIESYNPTQILTILLVALVGGLLVFATYRLTTDSAIYNRSFNICNVIITLITAVIMMMISSNIVISLGMVGALSIVRFRTAVKEARDTVFIFWSIVLGLCAGSQNFILAGISSAVICVVTVAFSLLNLGLGGGGFTLIVRATGSDTAAIEQAIKAGVGRFRLRAANAAGGQMELVYRIHASTQKGMKLVQSLNALEEVQQANLSEVDDI